MSPRLSASTKGKHPVFSLSGDDEYPAPLFRPGSSLQGLIDAAANFGVAAVVD
jgi:hypothetical protein